MGKLLVWTENHVEVWDPASSKLIQAIPSRAAALISHIDDYHRVVCTSVKSSIFTYLSFIEAQDDALQV